MRIFLVLILLAAAGCSSFQKHEEPADRSAPPRSQRQTDQLCMSDCMGNGGQAEFCKDRCTN
jgi:hypothetical protein